MPIYVVSDLHGAAGSLREAVPPGATLLLLGDLVNFLDYSSMEGILTEVFDLDDVAEVVRLRTAGFVDEARAVIRARSAGREEHVRAEIGRRVRLQYESVFEALPTPAYVILGNVDNPPVARALLAGVDGAHDADGCAIVLEGERFGFVGGGLPTAMHVPGEVPEAELRAKLDRLGEVDVLCSHVPPAVPELCFDTTAGKDEPGSRDLLEYIYDVRPRRAYFGHVHQPLVSAMRVGPTLCVNVGYFRATHRAWPHHGGS